MADPLISDAELAAILIAPVSATDDAGSVTMRSVDEILAVLEFKEKRAANKNPHRVLGRLSSVASPRGDY